MARRSRNVLTKASSEAELWAKQQGTAETALDFAISFLGCRMGPNKDEPIDDDAKSRLLAVVRAVSIVESRHGTTGANQPARDPFQCGNPKDAWWKEFTGKPGTGSRFVRGPGLSNLYAADLGGIAEQSSDFPQAAKRSLLAKVTDGHKDAAFSPAHSYVWGILYLIHRINGNAKHPTYACGDLSRDRLLDGAVTYNGGGVSDYRKRLENALKEFGDPLALTRPLARASFAPVKTPDVANLIAAGRSAGQRIRRVEIRFDSISSRPTLLTIEYDDRLVGGE